LNVNSGIQQQVNENFLRRRVDLANGRFYLNVLYQPEGVKSCG
jgi:hypothetical protein